jgi:hypothetical protein
MKWNRIFRTQELLEKYIEKSNLKVIKREWEKITLSDRDTGKTTIVTIKF